MEGNSLVALLAKNLPAVQETKVQSQGWEDPLEKEMATHSSDLAWKIPWTEKPGGLHSPWGHRVGQDFATEPPPYFMEVYLLDVNGCHLLPACSLLKLGIAK